jgi:aspartyl-tRNA(Asn)/glutamyl-tRNA(Gln) amidotransferase subunit C
MSVTMEDVRKVAYLARIKVEDSKIGEIRDSLNSILDFVDQLHEVDCSKVNNSLEYVTNLHEREDVVVSCDQSVMDNAPQKECNLFVVPKIIG